MKRPAQKPDPMLPWTAILVAVLPLTCRESWRHGLDDKKTLVFTRGNAKRSLKYAVKGGYSLPALECYFVGARGTGSDCSGNFTVCPASAAW